MSPLFLFSLFTIASSLCSVLALNKDHITCGNPFSCANKHDLYYPFWGSNRPGYCGPPSFELNCTGDVPEITIMAVTYRVLDIDFGTLTLTLSRKDYTDTLCSKSYPPEYKNSTFDSKQFKLASNARNITIYYDCSNSILDLTLGQFPCVNLDDTSYFGKSSSFGELGSCHDVVTTPISDSGLQSVERNPSQGNLVGAMRDGFGLQWYANEELCDKCRQTAGVCGYDDRTRSFACHCPNESTPSTCGQGPVGRQGAVLPTRIKVLIGILTGLGGLILVCVSLFMYRRKRTILSRSNKSIEEFLTPQGYTTMLSRNNKSIEEFLTPQGYTYAQLKKMTNSFSEMVGRGGFGTVYKGKLPGGDLVAVKVLKESKSDDQDFINEVVSMSRTSHVNVVKLVGFCYENTKRCIIYEYVSNGSLDDFVSTQDLMNLQYKTFYEIAVGIARGLEYLHRGCNTRIIHFDIKPQNILLDEDLCPKISDFGLAKLMKKKESNLSMVDARGTVGYVAPEVFSKNYGGASHKSDVYSYGMLVLEMLGARKNDYKAEAFASNTGSTMYFPDWIYKDLEQENDLKILMDESIGEEQETERKMILVSLWCIQTNPVDRPSMSKVVEMLEGNMEGLQIPPKPFLSSPVRSAQESSYQTHETHGSVSFTYQTKKCSSRLSSP